MYQNLVRSGGYGWCDDDGSNGDGTGGGDECAGGAMHLKRGSPVEGGDSEMGGDSEIGGDGDGVVMARSLSPLCIWWGEGDMEVQQQQSRPELSALSTSLSPSSSSASHPLAFHSLDESPYLHFPVLRDSLTDHPLSHHPCTPLYPPDRISNILGVAVVNSTEGNWLLLSGNSAILQVLRNRRVYAGSSGLVCSQVDGGLLAV
ncbi:hypothetical protein Tco_1229847 [Tanacetum coccineum]